MPIVPDRFKEARLGKGWRDQEECAKRLNTTQQTISQIENGTIKNPRNIDKYATELGVSIAWLMGETDNPTTTQSSNPARPVPFLSYDEIEGWLKKPTITKKHRVRYMHLSEKIVSKNLILVPISGDSMVSAQNAEESYFDGHEALVQIDRTAQPGDGVLVKIGNEIKLRKLTKDGTELILEALNPKYPNTKLEKSVKILGVVLYTQRQRVNDIE